MPSKRLVALRRLPPAERRILVAALWLLPLAGLSLRLAGLRRTCAWLHGLDRGGLCRVDGGQERVRSVARMVDIAARQLPYRPACLQCALVLWALLVRQGLDARLIIGVAKPGGAFAAHAWVELDHAVLNDDAQVRRHYAPIHWQARDGLRCGAQ
jgi:hypothetical protein